MDELVDTLVDYGEGDDQDYDCKLINADWSMTITFDTENDELLFNTVMEPNKWLAIGLANNLIESDIIQWVTASTEEKLVDESTVHDKISVRGVLLQNPQEDVSLVSPLEVNKGKVHMSTKRAFDTDDPLDTVIKMDSIF